MSRTADDVVVDAVLSASRTLVAVAERSLGAAAEETTLAQYRALVVLASRGPQRERWRLRRRLRVGCATGSSART